jgi:hypothetical protein
MSEPPDLPLAIRCTSSGSLLLVQRNKVCAHSSTFNLAALRSAWSWWPRT